MCQNSPVNSPVIGSNPTCILCAKFVGFEIVICAGSAPCLCLCFDGSGGNGLNSRGRDAAGFLACADVSRTGGGGGLSSEVDIMWRDDG